MQFAFIEWKSCSCHTATRYRTNWIHLSIVLDFVRLVLFNWFGCVLVPGLETGCQQIINFHFDWHYSCFRNSRNSQNTHSTRFWEQQHHAKWLHSLFLVFSPAPSRIQLQICVMHLIATFQLISTFNYSNNFSTIMYRMYVIWGGATEKSITIRGKKCFSHSDKQAIRF